MGFAGRRDGGDRGEDGVGSTRDLRGLDAASGVGKGKGGVIGLRRGR